MSPHAADTYKLRRESLRMIAADMAAEPADDLVAALDNHRAAIATLARIIETLLPDGDDLC